MIGRNQSKITKITRPLAKISKSSDGSKLLKNDGRFDGDGIREGEVVEGAQQDGLDRSRGRSHVATLKS